VNAPGGRGRRFVEPCLSLLFGFKVEGQRKRPYHFLPFGART
jgi:hypothetical protein